MILKVTKIYFLFFISFFFISCGKPPEKLPENYGIYANTDNGLIVLAEQKVQSRGNLLQVISGIKGASGAECSTLINFIVFEKDINPKYILLSKLYFEESGSVRNLLGNDLVQVNLWVKEKGIPFDVAPLERKKDMYRITPKEKLTEGFYALHFGGLDRKDMLEASIGNVVYDIVIGNKNNYLSKELSEKKIKEEATRLLQEMNRYFNSKAYDRIKGIYRPEGRSFTDPEWQEFIIGLATWFKESGSIKESRIVNSEVYGDEVVFAIETIYEKKGLQNEKLIVKKLRDAYFITALE